MKNYLIIVALLILMTGTGHAQQRVRKSVFSANTGVSLPRHEFAEKTFTYDAAFASPGPNVAAEYLWYGNFIGFSSGISYASFFFDEKAYRAEYDRTLGGYGTNKVSAGNYQTMSFLVGLALKIPEIGLTEVMVLLHLGCAVSVHPDLLVTNSELGVINCIDRMSDTEPMANAGIRINHWLNERYGVSLNGSLSTTRPGFSDMTGPGRAFFIPMNYLNINLGFVMRLNTPTR